MGEVIVDWYAAHRFLTPFYDGHSSKPDNVDLFLSDEPASVLGCASHYEVCSPESLSSEGCPVMGGSADDTPYSDAIQKNGADSLIPWITNSYMDIEAVIGSLTTSSLLSRRSLNSGIQGPIPDNQWQSEGEYWHDIGLVSLQDVVTSTTGPSNPDVLQYFWEAPDPFQREHLCKSQLSMDTSFPGISRMVA